MISKIKKFIFGEPTIKTERKTIFVKSPPVCIVCEKEMNSLKINQPFCNECLDTIKGVINKKKKKNERVTKIRG